MLYDILLAYAFAAICTAAAIAPHRNPFDRVTIVLWLFWPVTIILAVADLWSPGEGHEAFKEKELK
jgi:uncharacterized membrane protein YeiB